MRIANIMQRLSKIQRILLLAIVATTLLASEVAAQNNNAAAPQTAKTTQPQTAAPAKPATQAEDPETTAPETEEPAASESPTPEPKTPSLDQVKVLEVVRLGSPDEDPSKTPNAANTQEAKEAEEARHAARLQEIIVITVKDLRSLIRASKCLSDTDQPVPECNPQAIGLFLDGRHIKGLVPESGAPTLDETSGSSAPTDGTLQFHLQRNADSDEAWADLLGGPSFGRGFFTRPTEVSVGLENGYALPTKVKPLGQTVKERFWLVRMDPVWFIISFILLAFVLAALFILAWHSELLRDLGPTPVLEDWPGLARWWRERKTRDHKPYSLARFQMAFWFFLIIASFLFIWLVTGANDTINGSTLALIGIGAGTALGSAAIDAAGKGDGAPPPPGKTKGFLTDILTDHESGISFHRFQMFIWTLVLGILFLYSVWNRLSMPEFSATLLAMLGISSGTYLGFKIPEQQQAESREGATDDVEDAEDV